MSTQLGVGDQGLQEPRGDVGHCQWTVHQQDSGEHSSTQELPCSMVVVDSQAASSTYTDKDMCGSPATDYGYRETGTLHQATLTGWVPWQPVADV